MMNLLLLHGATGTKAQFDSLAPLLESHATIHRFDFEGHGTAPRRDRPFRIEHYAENVLDYLNEQGIAQIDIFGYSMGGYVALHLALTEPGRVGRIFTQSTKFAWSPQVAAQEAVLLDPDKILEKVPHYGETLRQQHGDDWRTVLAKTKDQMLALGDDPLVTEEAVSNLSHAVSISVGDRDKLVSIEESVAIYRALPNAVFQVMPNTPHPIDRASPQRLAGAILDFFA